MLGPKGASPTGSLPGAQELRGIERGDIDPDLDSQAIDAVVTDGTVSAAPTGGFRRKASTRQKS